MCMRNDYYHFFLSIKSLAKQDKLVYSLTWLFTKRVSVSFRGSKSWKSARSMFILSTPELPKQKLVYSVLTSKVIRIHEVSVTQWTGKQRRQL